MPHHRGPHREVLGSVIRQKVGGTLRARAFIVLFMGRIRQGRISGHRTGWFEKFQWALGHRGFPKLFSTGPCYLALVIRKGTVVSLVGQIRAQIKDVLGGMGSGIVCLHLKDILIGNL